MEREKIHYIQKDFKHQTGSDEGFRVYTMTNVHSGESEVVLETSQTTRYPLNKLNEVLELADRISGGGGRRRISTNEIIAIALHHGVVTPEPEDYLSTPKDKESL